jgi:hypothetical protein
MITSVEIGQYILILSHQRHLGPAQLDLTVGGVKPTSEGHSLVSLYRGPIQMFVWRRGPHTNRGDTTLRFWTDSPNIGNKIFSKKKKWYQFRTPLHATRAAHTYCCGFLKKTVDAVSDTGPHQWRHVGLCRMGHLWAIFNTFAIGSYAPQSSFLNKTVSRPFFLSVLIHYMYEFYVLP